ncbi:MAG: HAD-IIB family hydrolase [Clostridia bacterium]|nr:HAD-IIB family hydrolase [Clostridia bacterium]
MSKFKGVLIVSDWDGTVIKDGVIPGENIEAIKRFQSEGGRFTICSGRPLDYLLDRFSDFAPNTYLATLNGAIITTLDGERLFEGFLGEEIFPILEELAKYRPPTKLIALYLRDGEKIVRHSPGSVNEILDKYREANIYKLVLITDSESDSARIKSMLDRIDLGKFIAVNSWSTGTELLRRDHSKGAAIRRIKERIGARISVAVGDYENDIELLSAADISFAVGDGIEALKAIADHVTVMASEGALADVISRLEDLV